MKTVFIYRDIVHRRYLPGELYPLKRGKYGNISIRIPNKSVELKGLVYSFKVKSAKILHNDRPTIS